MSLLLTTIAFLLLFLLLIIVTNYLHKKRKWSSERSRKFIHVTGGLLSLGGARFFQSHWYVLTICGIAFVILLLTFVTRTLPSIHDTKRVSFGSIVFPIPIYGCFLASQYWGNELFFYLPIALLTISDPVAEWGGKKWGHRSASFFSGQKTLAGSMCFALSAFVLNFLMLFYFGDFQLAAILGYGFILTLVTTLAELTTLKGFDNITVPLSAVIALYLMLHHV